MAELYGFASEHEIQKVMEAGLTPGPFSAEPPIPSFFKKELPSASGPDCITPDDPRYRDKVERTWIRIRRTENEEWSDARKMAIVEAGFFCAPKLHRQLLARVQRGLIAFAST